MARTGRPKKPYQPSWGGDPIPGLYRRGDGRWVITETGKIFTEHDEHIAVNRFKALTTPRKKFVTVAETPVDPHHLVRDAFSGDTGKRRMMIKIPHDPTEPVIVSHQIPDQSFFDTMRHLLINEPDLCAERCGIAGLRTVAIDVPKASITLEKIKTVYLAENGATEKSKQEAWSAMEKLIKHSGAKTLDDLTQDKLNAFRTYIESKIAGPATRKAYYSRIKFIIAFGLKVGMDSEQIRAALDRAKVLWTAEALPPLQPKPISRDHFHTLLNTGNGSWRPWLLLGLNLCLHMEEVCGLKWEHFNLEAGTYAAIREKTKRAKIPRAATLWPETVEALKVIPRRGPYIFISTHGTRYNKNTRVNDFKDLREAAKLPASVTFDTIRDGAYTAAVQGTEEKFARVLAGHKSAGLQDNYVLRNPNFVRPACDAVFAHYGPFPILSK